MASKTPHPCSAQREVVVLFVVGGLSPTEIGQVQKAISLYNKDSEADSTPSSSDAASSSIGSLKPLRPRIILGSNNLISPDGVCRQVYAE